MKQAQTRGHVRQRISVKSMVVAAVVIVLNLVLLIAMYLMQREPSTPSTPVGTPAPAATGTLDVETPAEQPFVLSRRKGSWVVLNFFAHDCVPCIQEHPELVRFVEGERRRPDQGVEFYSVVQHSTPDEVAAFFAQRGGRWPVIYDTEFEFHLKFGVVRVPETWVINPQGVVSARIVSNTTADVLHQTMRDVRGT